VAHLQLFDTKPEFGFDRTAAGDVTLEVRADGVTVRVTVGCGYDDVSLLAVSLGHLAEDLTDQILDRWDDMPYESATTDQAPG
jgi:hypothetical protein